MKKLLVYSHDTYGLGNIRRMLAICHHLLEVIPELSILLVTGSPVIHSLRLPSLLDYIKLPCLTRVGRDEYKTKYLSDNIVDAIRLRSDLILSTVRNFKPDMLIVDKKPMGVKGELADTLSYLQVERPETRQLLILRDILDSPQTIKSNWTRNGHYEAIKKHYDSVLILGERRIFDLVREYDFPASVAGKVEFCGYIRREAEPHIRERTRGRLQINEAEKLVLVTSGGGQDGYSLIENYLSAVRAAPADRRFKSLLVFGPEMPEPQRTILQRRAANERDILFQEFAGDMIGLMAAADVVISMGGYNSICEILSLKKRAIIIPRFRPTEEQWIRADRLSRLGYFKTIHPDELRPDLLLNALLESLMPDEMIAETAEINLDGLPVVAARVKSLVFGLQD
ncbi:MAG: glycosyltransferase family protein [Blastocatellales bacterium]